MTRQQTAETAVRFLYTVLEQDINAVAKIANAHAQVLEGNENGYKTIIEALDGLVEFIQELADDLERATFEIKEEQQ
jgi:hypothetical protein